MKVKIRTRTKRLLADTLTPVNIYLKIRDVFAGSILLESSDYHGHENSLSYLCCDPISSFLVRNEKIDVRYPDKSASTVEIKSREQVIEGLQEFVNSFEASITNPPTAGLFGYISFDAVRYFEDVSITLREREIPDILYKLYRYVIVVNHFTNELTICEHYLDGQDVNGLEKLEKLIYGNRFSTFSFQRTGEESSNLNDQDYLQMVREGIKHCLRGDVFQIVLSRRYSHSFKGDEFNVYRSLRSINPSPYLFYFDYGGFKIFGSSPEAQLQIKNGVASIYPIAGTFKRSGDDKLDTELAEKLSRDEKENAEHVMLVDLARNDLSRFARKVSVEVFREVQYYSHVIHLVSKVTGQMINGTSSVEIATSSFPAGTLSGAPKPMAISLIDRYENVNRGYYGGAIGFLGFHGEFNHAIMIRTFLSKENKLISQAGAGIVARSNPDLELAEVNNKLEALRKAVIMAETI